MSDQDVWKLQLPEDFIAVSIPYTHKWNAPIWDYNEDKIPQVGLIALFSDGVDTIGESTPPYGGLVLLLTDEIYEEGV